MHGIMMTRMKLLACMHHNFKHGGTMRKQLEFITLCINIRIHY